MASAVAVAVILLTVGTAVGLNNAARSPDDCVKHSPAWGQPDGTKQRVRTRCMDAKQYRGDPAQTREIQIRGSFGCSFRSEFLKTSPDVGIPSPSQRLMTRSHATTECCIRLLNISARSQMIQTLHSTRTHSEYLSLDQSVTATELKLQA